MMLSIRRDKNFFFFNDTATTEIYTLSLHDALPILPRGGDPGAAAGVRRGLGAAVRHALRGARQDRKSTRLNSSHSQNSYSVFCLKKKKYPSATFNTISLVTEIADVHAHIARTPALC